MVEWGVVGDTLDRESRIEVAEVDTSGTICKKRFTRALETATTHVGAQHSTNIFLSCSLARKSHVASFKHNLVGAAEGDTNGCRKPSRLIQYCQYIL